MLENILSFAGYALIVVLSIVLYVYLISKALPDICVRWQNPKKKLGDRGLRKYKFPEGRGVVYEPEVRIRRFIKQYALIYYNGNKYLKCFINKKIRFMKYDIMVYGPASELLDIISVTERITDESFSKAVALPKDTSYVNVVLRVADNMYKSGETAVRYSKGSLAVLCSLVAFVSVVEAYVIRIIATKLVSQLTSGWAVYVNNGRFLIHSVVLGVVCAVVFLLSYLRRTVKVVNNERR